LAQPVSTVRAEVSAWLALYIEVRLAALQTHCAVLAGSMAAIEAGCPCASPARAMWKLQSWEGYKK
jgi:hypothetical protein